MVFNNFDDCIKNFEKIPNMEFDEFCSFFNDVLREFPDRKKYLLDLFYDFENLSVDNESNFIAVADSIVCIYKDVNDLPLLLSYFDDSKEPEWAFDSLMTTVAKYPDPEYTESLLDHLSVLLPHAVEWASYLLGRIFNSGEKSHKIVWNHLHECPKGSLKTVLENMLKDEGWEHLFPYIRFLLKELDKKE